jgi:hypothetical protein
MDSETEVTGEEGGPIRVELSAALNKVYGEVAAPPPNVVDVETVPAGADGKLQITDGKGGMA